MSPNASDDLLALLNAAVDAIIVIDARGLIEEFNPAAEALFGYHALDIRGANVSTLMPEPDRSLHDRYLERYLNTGEARVIGIGREIVARRRDGSVFPAGLSVGRIPGTPARFVGIVHDLSLQKQTEQALVRERDKARSYLELAQVMLVALDTQANIVMINRKGCEILDRDESELLGHNWILTCVPPADAVAVRQAFDRVMRGDPLMEYHENCVLTSNGDERLIAWRNRLTRDASGRLTGTLSSGLDITEQRDAENALRKSETLLRTAQEIAGLGNFELHLRPQAHDYVSQQALDIVGLSREWWQQDPARLTERVIHADDLARVRQSFAQTLAGEHDFEEEFVVVRGPNDWRHVYCRLQLVRQDPAGEPLLSGILHDITQRKLAESEARASHDRLTHVSRLSTMGEMAAGIAHEINQPLTAISNYAQAGRRLLANADERSLGNLAHALEQIGAQAVRAGEVIRRLRALVRQQETRRELLDGNRIVGDIVTLAESDARANQVTLALDLAAELPQLHVDAVQIQQVLLNLLRNSIDASQRVADERRIVTIRTRQVGEEIEFAVLDHGCGVPAGEREQLFEPFFTTKSSGTGLGLSISRSIVRAHGGKIRYEPNSGGGSAFLFTLPASVGVEA